MERKKRSLGKSGIALVAITGNLCSGKSFINKMVGRLGFPVFSCDKEISKLLKKKTIIDEVQKFFPEAVLNNSINKKTLTEIIFKNKRRREQLERLLFGDLFIAQDKFIEGLKHKQTKIAFFEVPLLYEKSLQDKYDFVIVTHAKKKTMFERAQKRGIDSKLFCNILKAQMSGRQKRQKADYVINTEKQAFQIRENIKKIIKEIVDGRENNTRYKSIESEG